MTQRLQMHPLENKYLATGYRQLYLKYFKPKWDWVPRSTASLEINYNNFAALNCPKQFLFFL